MKYHLWRLERYERVYRDAIFLYSSPSKIVTFHANSFESMI